MSDDIIKTRGSMKNYSNDRGGATLITAPVLGIVKNNIDPTRSGRIQVYLKRLNSPDSDNPKTWTTVSYLSPFFGSVGNTNSPDNAGSYIGNPQSYGFWATPPDVNTEVICIFLNGDPTFGYYIGCVPKAGLMYMVPALGSSDNIIANNGPEADNYGGATRLPVTEINNANPKQNNNINLINQPRPVNSSLAAILNNQGLLRDPDRGTIGSSSSRESPSRVFGLSTPGRPIYKGGYDDSTIKDATKDKSIPDKNFSIIGRTGGHSIVLDDGDLEGKDQLMRFRTSTGHQILLSDSAQTLFIIHANGQSYIELGKEGTIDMYSTNSVNIRTQGDLNLHADNDININAAKNFNISAENIKMESSKGTTSYVGTTFKGYVKGEFTLKVDSKLSMLGTGDVSLASKASTYINGGPNINLNSGSSSLVPAEVKLQTLIAHTDTLHDDNKGYAAAPGKLQSIVSRAPAHSPWASANQGVNVKSNLSASANFPAPPSPAVSAINNAVPSSPANPTNPGLAATVPNVPSASSQLDKTVTSAVVSQMAVNAATGDAADAVKAGAGIVDVAGTKVAVIGDMCLNPSQLVDSGHLKPGSDTVINSMIASGKSLDQALAPNFFTGKDGVKNLTQLVDNVPAQTGAAVALVEKGLNGLKSAGVISGNESGTQVAGLALSAATQGLGPTIAFAKDAVSGALGNAVSGALGNAVSGAIGNAVSGAIGGLGGAVSGALGAAGMVNGALGKVGDLISGGNLAANLADKALGPLAGISLDSVLDKAKGLAAGVFDKVTSSFKSLKANVAQNLTAIKSANDKAAAAADAAGSTADAAKAALLANPLVAASASSLTGALGSAGGALGGALGGAVSGAIGNAVSGAIGNAVGGALGGLGGAVGGALGNAVSGALGNAVSGLVNNATGPGIIPSVASVSSFASNIGTSISGGASAVVNQLADDASVVAKSLGTDAAGLNNLPGGASSVSNIVNLGSGLIAASAATLGSVSSLIPGASGITDAISNKLGSLGGALPSLGSLTAGLGLKLPGGIPPSIDLKAFASTGLGAGDIAKLNSAMSSIGSGGPVDIKLPTIATGTFDVTALKARAKALLGNPLIPSSIKFGSASDAVDAVDSGSTTDAAKAALLANPLVAASAASLTGALGSAGGALGGALGGSIPSVSGLVSAATGQIPSVLSGGVPSLSGAVTVAQAAGAAIDATGITGSGGGNSGGCSKA